MEQLPRLEAQTDISCKPTTQVLNGPVADALVAQEFPWQQDIRIATFSRAFSMCTRLVK